MITSILLFHAKKMQTWGVPAPKTWLVVFTLLFLSVAAGAAEETTTVKVITTPVFTQIPRLQASKDFQVLVRVEAPPAVQLQRRVPVDLAVVVNVGAGGATGTGTGKARLDAVKKAVKFIIWQILQDDDRLAVVGPSSIRRVFADEATGFLNTRKNAEKSVDELEPRGDRAEFTFGSSLEEAIKILGELPATASGSRRARFIILVTDTATTEDSSRFSKLLRREDDLPPPVHTLGLGSAYDPRALLDIARASQGTYSFVDDGESTDAITGAIAVCLSGLKDVVAVDTRVRVETPVGSGVTIERIQSGGYMTSSGTGTGEEKTSGEVAVGVLYAGEVKSFLVHLSVPALHSTSTTTSMDGCDKQQLLTASFVGHYTTTTGDEEDDTAPSTQAAILYVQRPAPEAIDDVVAGGGVQRVPVPVVMNHIARFAALDMVTTFVDTHIWQRSSITAEVAAKLRGQWEQFVQARQFWSGLDLGALDVEVTRMVTILETAAAGTRSGSSSSAYILSWLSSYQMQRPTAMGAPGSVAAAFVTVNVQLVLQQVRMGTTACPRCDGDGGCVQATPPAVLVPSGRDDGTYVVNAVYQSVVPPGVLMDAINEAMKHMYLALIQANKLRTCDADAAAGVGVLEPPPWPQSMAFA